MGYSRKSKKISPFLGLPLWLWSRKPVKQPRLLLARPHGQACVDSDKKNVYDKFLILSGEILDGLSRAVEARGLARIGELTGARAGAWAEAERATADPMQPERELAENKRP